MTEAKRSPWRPSTYKEEYCDVVIEVGKGGGSVAEMALACDCVKSSLYEWAKKHEDFSNAFMRAKVHAQVWWEKKGTENLCNKEFNNPTWAKSISCRFPDDYREERVTRHGNVEGEELVMKYTSEELAILKEKGIDVLAVDDS